MESSGVSKHYNTIDEIGPDIYVNRALYNFVHSNCKGSSLKGYLVSFDDFMMLVVQKWHSTSLIKIMTELFAACTNYTVYLEKVKRFMLMKDFISNLSYRPPVGSHNLILKNLYKSVENNGNKTTSDVAEYDFPSDESNINTSKDIEIIQSKILNTIQFFKISNPTSDQSMYVK